MKQIKNAVGANYFCKQDWVALMSQPYWFEIEVEVKLSWISQALGGNFDSLS